MDTPPYLPCPEINGWLLTMGGTTILIDPVLEGVLDFGMPALYSASKCSLRATGLLQELPHIDALLITQGLDDHAHERTLRRLAVLEPTLPVIAPPSSATLVSRLFSHVTYIASRNRRLELPYLGLDALPTLRLPEDDACEDEAVIEPRPSVREGAGPRGSGAGAARAPLRVRATSGALVGPPWQRRENGYLIQPRPPHAGPSVYLEPHVE